LLSAVALVIAVLCVAASAVRLRFALVPTGMAPEALESALSHGGGALGRGRLERAVASEPRAFWERALFESLRTPSPQREALVNEQLTELDYLVQKWVRVPRVCASICTSSGFLLAATVLRTSLAMPSEVMDGQAVDAAVLQAINVAAIGLAGAAFCVAIQMRARRAAASSELAFDRLVGRLERVGAEGPPGLKAGMGPTHADPGLAEAKGPGVRV
jgi:hypothetical protein